MIPLIIGGMLLALLLLLGAALGRRILILLRVRSESLLEQGALAMGLGLGALQFLPFALFATGFGKPIGIRVATAVLAIALLRDMAAVVRGGLRLAGGLRRLEWWRKL